MTLPAADLTSDHKRYFIEKLGLSERLMERCLGEALSAGGDYADLYFESVTSTSLGIDESLVKSASQGISVGCGIRVVSGERTGYAYTDDLSSDRLLRAARTAALIASGPAKEQMSGFRHTSDSATLYPITGATADAEISAKLELIQRADYAGAGGLQRRAAADSCRCFGRHVRLGYAAAGTTERLRHRQGCDQYRARDFRRGRTGHSGLF
jgi:TldD protein